MNCLAAGVPIRGGLDLNVAFVERENELYGPAALEAYRLESEVAQYPRVAVGDKLVGFLQAASNSPRQDMLTEVYRAEARICLQFLAVAQDRVPFVHFLGPGFRRLLFGKEHTKLVTMGLDFAIREHERFVELADKKLESRYGILRDYYARYAPNGFRTPERRCFRVDSSTAFINGYVPSMLGNR